MEEALRTPELKRKRVVLVVEDETVIRSIAAEYLRDAGFSVVEACNALEAVAVISSSNSIDLVFTDIQMPGKMDGAMLVSWINAHNPNLPVIATSGAMGISPDLQGAYFLHKPYRLGDVERKINEMLKQSSDDNP